MLSYVVLNHDKVLPAAAWPMYDYYMAEKIKFLTFIAKSTSKHELLLSFPKTHLTTGIQVFKTGIGRSFL